jgi:hypothetical protein
MDDEKQKQMLELFAELRAEEPMLDAETRRNVDNIDIFEAMIRYAYEGVTMVVAGHHIMFMREGRSTPGEVASADTLIFDHFVAKKVWGEKWLAYLTLLAAEPVETRDQLLRCLYLGRKNGLEHLERNPEDLGDDAQRRQSRAGS